MIKVGDELQKWSGKSWDSWLTISDDLDAAMAQECVDLGPKDGRWYRVVQPDGLLILKSVGAP